MTLKKTATARANSNIALVKYWGKRDRALNLPEAGSLSVTLEGLTTTTTVSFGGERDALYLNGQLAPEPALRKALRVIELIRNRAQLRQPVRIESSNSFPTGAGLASSASGIAALTVAAARAAGLALPKTELSAIARVGSGSACRSIWGGFVEWLPGSRADGTDSFAQQVCSEEFWDLRVLVAVVADKAKAMGSTEGMLHTQATSPFHPAFIASTVRDLDEARAALLKRDFRRLGRVARRSSLRMHADMMAADPPIIYFQPETLEVISLALSLEREHELFFTIDAGPNVKLFCTPTVEPHVMAALETLPCVQRIITARPGRGAEVVEA